MKILFLDCFSGISGDMLIGAFLDAGFKLKVLKDELRKIDVKGYKIKSKKVVKGGIAATRFIVEADSGHHPYRSWKQIKVLINRSKLENKIKKLSVSIFQELAEAESKIHNRAAGDVRFHEIGGVDSIIDIVGAAVIITKMKFDEIYTSPLPLGKGFINSAHGRLPLPAPATLEILKDKAVLLKSDAQGENMELVTPTGAAIIKTVCSDQDLDVYSQIKIRNTAYGAGSRISSQRPNLLRIIIGDIEEKSIENIEDIYLLETNIDDVTPQVCGFLMQKLFDAGALDVLYIPVYMKKNRPGVLLKVICRDNKISAMKEIVFNETTTLGIRLKKTKRIFLARKVIKIKLWGKTIRVKVADKHAGGITIIPEYEDCLKIAEDKNISLMKVIDKARSNAEEKYNRGRR
jgi:uncharacterized protein (TIGR00299 family) protein